MIVLYPYDGSFNVAQLEGEVRAVLPPPAYLTGSGPGPGQPASHVEIAYASALAPAQKTQLDGVVAAHVPQGPRKARPLWSIRGDVQALSVGQFNNVWNDLTAAVPGGPARKYLTSYGVNAGPIFTMDWSLYVSGPTAAQVKAGQISLTAMFCQDQPSYLWHPPFDPSIAIDGSEPA